MTKSQQATETTSYASKTLRLYWQHIREHKKLFWPLVVALPLTLLLNNYLSAWIIAQVINKLTTNTVTAANIWDTFGAWILAYILLLVIGELVLWRLAMYWYWRLETNVTYRLNKSSFETLATQSMDFHTNRFGGALVSQVNKFTSAYSTLLNAVIFNVIPLACAFVFTFVILGPQMPLFTAGLAALSLLFMFITLISFKAVRRLNVREAESQNKLSGQLADSITNIMTIKSHGSEATEQSRYDQLNQQAQSASFRVMYAVMKRDIGFGTVIVLMGALSFTFLVGGNVWFDIPIGTLVLAITYTGLVLGQLWGFNEILRKFSRSFGDAQEMTKVHDTAKSVSDKPDAPDLKITTQSIAFRNITFQYSDADDSKPLFHKFNLTIPSGQHVGLVGQSGSGKTTLTKLLLRFTDISDGSITIDDQNIADITQTSLRKNIAYVPQEPMLFHRSLRENIAYSKPGATDEEIEEAARNANALDFIEKLPFGFHTTVGERGAKLSGGQRQRIAIARAMLKDAPILILDEATSALDSESEKLIQDALEKLMKGRTSIVIAHRLSTVSKLDRIIVMQHGEIIEDGTHEDLAKADGTYARLWSHQSGGFIEQ